MPDQRPVQQKLLKNTAYNTVLTFFSRIGGLIFTIILARILLPERFGIYTLALTIILTIATFTDLGINGVVMKYVSESLKNKNHPKARSRLAFAFNFKIFLTAVFSIAVFVLAHAISIHIFKKPDLLLPLQIGAIYLFTYSIQGFLSAIFYTLQRVDYNTISEFIFQIARIGIVIMLLMFNKTITSVFISLIIATIIAIIFSFIVLTKKYPFLIKGKRPDLDYKERKRLLTFLGWVTISSISAVFFVNIDTFILGIFLKGAEFIAYYQSIFSIVGSVAAFVAFNSLLLPVFSQFKKGNFEKSFQKISKYISLVVIPIAIGLCFVIVPAIKILYGNAYVPSNYHLAILITSILLSLLVIEIALTSVYSSIFQAKEKPKILAILIVFAAITNIVLSYFFVKIGISIAPQYALVGDAAATLIARFGALIVLGILAKKTFNIKFNWKYLTKPIIATAIMAVFLFLFTYFIKMNILTLILAIVFAALVYLIVMFIIKGVKKDDFKINNLLKYANEKKQA